MRVSFLHNGYESLGIEQLSAALKKAGHETSLVIDPSLFAEAGFWKSPLLSRVFDLKKEVLKDLKADKPDLVCFSVFTDTYRWSLDWAGTVKKELGVPVVFGGIHPTSVPEHVIAEDCVDHICVGEGDHALPALARALSGKYAGPIDNIWSKIDGKIIKGGIAPAVSPDALEFADKDIFYSRYPFYSGGYLISASRGCPFSCAYCANNVYARLYGGSAYARKRSPDHVLAELALAKKRWSPTFVHFTDEVFNWDPAWLKTFLERYAQEAALPFSCYIYPDLLDAASAKLLKQAGCFKVQLGVQTFDGKRRLETLKRPSSNKKIAEAIALLKKEGIYTVCDSILGLPGDTSGDLRNLADFFAENTPDQNEVFYLKYYPGTELTGGALKDGLLTGAELSAIENGAGPSGIIDRPGPSGRELRTFFKTLIILPFIPKVFRKHFAGGKLLARLLPGNIFLRVLLRLLRRPLYDFNTAQFVRRYRHFISLRFKLWLKPY